MHPLCDCGEKSTIKICVGKGGMFGMQDIDKYFCAGCYGKYLANKSVDKLKTDKAL